MLRIFKFKKIIWIAGGLGILAFLLLKPWTEIPAKEGPQKTKEKFGDGTRDLVDEASWESFPASDPPPWWS